MILELVCLYGAYKVWEAHERNPTTHWRRTQQNIMAARSVEMESAEDNMAARKKARRQWRQGEVRALNNIESSRDQVRTAVRTELKSIGKLR